MDHAIILAAGFGIDGESLENYINIEYCSVNHLKRLVITAQRAGIKKFTIISEIGAPSLTQALGSDKRITSKVDFRTLESSIDIDPGKFLLLQSNILTTPSALSEFLNTDLPEDSISILVDRKKDGWVKLQGENVADSYLDGAISVGAFILGSEILQKFLKHPSSLASLVNDLLKERKVFYKEFRDGYWMRLSTEEGSIKRAEDLIFSHVGKTATGWISRKINSRFSLPTSRLLIKTPLTPNMISILINVIGVLCGPFYILGHPVIGALFMYIATVLDRCDGEVARIKLMETKKGQWVDTISDQFTVLSFLIGVPVGYYLINGNHIVLIIGAINISIFIFFLCWSFYFLVKYTNSGSLASYFEVDDIIGEGNTTLLKKIILFVRPLGRRNVYSMGILVVAIIGGYPWVLFFVTLASLLFLAHQVEDIFKLRKIKHTKLS